MLASDHWAKKPWKEGFFERKLMMAYVLFCRFINFSLNNALDYTFELLYTDVCL